MIVQWAGTRRTGLVSHVVTWSPGILNAPVAVALAGVLDFAGSLTSIFVYQVSMDGTASFDGGLSLLASVPLDGSLSSSGITLGVQQVAVDGAVSMGGELALKAQVMLNGVLTTASDLVWAMTIGLDGALSFVGEGAGKTYKSLAGAVSFTGAVSLISFTLTILANAIQARYRPRPLISIVVAGTTKHYSTEDIETP